jgi:hypothetical protein
MLIADVAGIAHDYRRRYWRFTDSCHRDELAPSF